MRRALVRADGAALLIRRVRRVVEPGALGEDWAGGVVGRASERAAAGAFAVEEEECEEEEGHDSGYCAGCYAGY